MSIEVKGTFIYEKVVYIGGINDKNKHLFGDLTTNKCYIANFFIGEIPGSIRKEGSRDEYHIANKGWYPIEFFMKLSDFRNDKIDKILNK